MPFDFEAKDICMYAEYNKAYICTLNIMLHIYIYIYIYIYVCVAENINNILFSKNKSLDR